MNFEQLIISHTFLVIPDFEIILFESKRLDPHFANKSLNKFNNYLFVSYKLS